MSALARAAKSAKQKQKEELKTKREKILLQNQLSSVKEELNSLKQILNEKQETQSTDISTCNSILQDILEHANGSPSDFTNETYELALKIKAASPKAYTILSEHLCLPTLSQVERKLKEAIGNIPEKLTDINYVCDLVNLWKEKNGISKSENIDACLAVDALYFKPDFKITEDDCVSGYGITDELKKTLPSGTFKLFDKSPSALQAFLELNWDRIIKAGFVFQIQPYNVLYKPFVFHIKPSPNGKASEEIVELLQTIREKVLNRRICIKSFAFDGDNAYKQLHLMYFESYIHEVIKANQMNTSYTNNLRIVSDYLHLLKRLRYRLLDSVIHSGFDLETDKIIIEELQEVLDEMSDVVWRNEPYTKMHDKLPLELFKTENLLKLIDTKNFTAAAYWFPITLSNIAIHEENIGFEYREFLLKCAFYFLVYYFECWERTDGSLRQRKHNENMDVTFYTKELLIEFTNTLHAHIQLMNNIEHYNFRRNSSTPLEHKFAYGRAKSRDINTLTRFVNVISSIQGVETEKICQEISSFNEEADEIKGRFLGSSITVESKDEDYGKYSINTEFDDDLPYSPQNVAKAFLVFAGFDTPTNENINYDEIYCWTEFFLSNFVGEPLEQRRKSFMTFNTSRLGVDNCQKSRKLIFGKPVFAPQTFYQNRKQENKVQALNELCLKKYGSVTKKNLLELVKKIRKADPNCPTPPTTTQSKYEIFGWLIENLPTYYVVLNC